MKQTIRINTFETNSSSEHSCILCSDEEYNKLISGDLWIGWCGELKSTEELYDEYKKETNNTDMDGFENWLKDDGNWYSIAEKYQNSNLDWVYEPLEYDEQTKEINGVTVHAICRYGYDG